MSTTPRSSLKKRTGTQDDRRVSFASPLSSEKVAPPLRKKQHIISNTGKASPSKKSKPSDELVDIISLVNQQSEVIEEIFDIENKFTRHSRMTQDLTNELTNFIEYTANSSTDSTRVKSQLEEQSLKLASLETGVTDLIKHANSLCSKFETRIAARSQYSAGILEVQKAFSSINCTKLDSPDSLENVNYDDLLAMIDQLEICAGNF